MQTSLEPIAKAARADKKKRFKSLYSFLNRVMFEKAYNDLNKNASAGIDKVTWREYGKNLEANLLDLETRLKEKRYHARFVKRVLIPKGKNKFRPLGIPALEEKIVQWVVREILQSLFEPIFLNCSYGYRENRSPRQASDALWEKLMAGRYRWVVEADIRSFFDTIEHEKLLTMVEKRVNDQALTRLIRKWLRAGIVLENGDIKYPEEGTVQGNIISPILANIYLHYALDQWFERTIKPGCKGQATLIRYADDFVACFEHERPATNFYKNLPNRFKGFGLEIAEEKTKKLKFNRFERESSESFTFLGFVYTRDISRKGNHIVRRKTDKKKFRNKVQDFKKWCKENRHRRTRWIMEMVKSKMRGFRNYYGVSGNGGSINALIWHYTKILFKWLNRRSQRRSYNWDRFNELLKFYNVFSLRRLTCEGYQLNFLSCLA